MFFLVCCCESRSAVTAHEGGREGEGAPIQRASLRTLCSDAAPDNQQQGDRIYRELERGELARNRGEGLGLKGFWGIGSKEFCFEGPRFSA